MKFTLPKKIMANVDLLIPFILRFEAGVAIKDLSLPLPQIFEKARKRGFSNDPLDSGGATMCGVTLATYRQYRRNNGQFTTTVSDLKNISYTEWRAILKQLYWDRWKADKIQTQEIADILVDWVWASGIHGIKQPQKILVNKFPEVVADGIVGTKTLNAVNNYDTQRDLFTQIHKARIRFVNNIVSRNPTQRKWLNGWLRRINSLPSLPPI